MSNIVLNSFFGSGDDNGAIPAMSIEQMEAESHALYQAEEITLAADPSLKNDIDVLRILRADRIKRQKEYLNLDLNGETIQLIEQLPTDKQKWAALKEEAYLSDYKDMDFSLQAWVAEEQALEQAKSMGQTIYLNAQFAAARSRDRRKVQAEAVKRIQEAEKSKTQEKLNEMRSLTAQRRAEREQKYTAYVKSLPCQPDRYMPEWGLFRTLSAGLTDDYMLVGNALTYNNNGTNTYFKMIKDIPVVFRTFTRSPLMMTTKDPGVFVLKKDLMELAKQQVKKDPYNYFNPSRWFRDSTATWFNTPPVFSREPSMTFSYSATEPWHTATGLNDFSYLAKAILDECYPFYEDYASGQQPYPHFIDYGENVPWPTPEQFLNGIYKILGVGELAWGQKQVEWMQRVSEINADPNSQHNFVFNAPQNIKYFHPKISGSLPPYPIEGKPNPGYKPWLLYKHIYNLSDSDAKIYYENWVLPMGWTKLSQVISIVKGLSLRKEHSGAYYNLNLRQLANSGDRDMINAIQGANLSNEIINKTMWFQDNWPAIYEKVVGHQQHWGYKITEDIYNYYKDDEWFANAARPDRASYLNTNEGYANVFPEIGPFNIPTYFSTRPKKGFVYLPKIGYMNPLLAINVPFSSIQSANKYYQSRDQAIAAMDKKSGLFALSDFVKGIANPATAAATVMPGLANSSFGRYILSSSQQYGMFTLFMHNVLTGTGHIDRDMAKAAIGIGLQAASMVATAGTAGVAAAATSAAVGELSKMGLANTDFGRALLTIAQAVTVSQAASTSFAQALSSAMEREAKNQLVRAVVKSTDLSDSIVGIVAVQTLVEVAGDAAMERDWMQTLADSSKKGAMKLAASQVPGGQILVQAALDVYNEGWSSILPSVDVGKILKDPKSIIENIDWKKLGNKIVDLLKQKESQQALLLLASGRVSPETLAKTFVEAKLAEDLAKRTAVVDVERDPNDPGVQAAAKLTQEIQLARRRNEILEELMAGRKPRREDLKMLNPMAEYYWDILQQIIPEGQQAEALTIGLKIGMPDIRDYLSFSGPKLNLPKVNLPSLDLPSVSMPSLPGFDMPSVEGFTLPGSSLLINVPFSVPKLSLMELGIDLPTMPSIGPDRLKLADLPKLNIDLDLPTLENICKDIMPRNVKLDPVMPTPGLQPGYNIIDINGNLKIRPLLAPSLYEHSMLTYGHVPRHETPEVKLYNQIRETEMKLVLLELQKAEIASLNQ